MRFVYLALVLLITLAVVTFKVQNVEAVTVTFLSASLTLPVSMLILGIYIVGMLTGSMLLTFIRSLVLGATKPVQPPR